MHKMIMAVIPRDQTEQVLEALVAAGYTATVNDSRGGVLRQAQQTLFIAVPIDEAETVMRLIRHSCQPQAASPPPIIGPGAAIFTWLIDSLEA